MDNLSILRSNIFQLIVTIAHVRHQESLETSNKVPFTGEWKTIVLKSDLILILMFLARYDVKSGIITATLLD